MRAGLRSGAVAAPEGGRGLKPPIRQAKPPPPPHRPRLVGQKAKKKLLKKVFAFLLINWPYKSQNPVEQLKNCRKLPIFDLWTPNRASFLDLTMPLAPAGKIKPPVGLLSPPPPRIHILEPLLEWRVAYCARIQ